MQKDKDIQSQTEPYIVKSHDIHYVNAVDELLKTDDENPTIGLLVCSDMDKNVESSVEEISKNEIIL